MNAYIKFGENLSIYSQDSERKRNYDGRTEGTNGLTDNPNPLFQSNLVSVRPTHFHGILRKDEIKSPHFYIYDCPLPLPEILDPPLIPALFLKWLHTSIGHYFEPEDIMFYNYIVHYKVAIYPSNLFSVDPRTKLQTRAYTDTLFIPILLHSGTSCPLLSLLFKR